MRKLLPCFGGLLATAALFTGCASCDNCYDYCGPVINEGYYGGSDEYYGPQEAVEGEYYPDQGEPDGREYVTAKPGEKVVPGSVRVTEGTARR